MSAISINCSASKNLSSHQILGNPLDNIGNTCLNCHHDSEEGFRAIIKRKLERKYELAKQATVSIATAHLEAQKAWELGASEEEMRPALMDIRKGQWRWDFALASHGSFFHAPEEMLRIVADATHYGQEARIKLRAILAKYGAGDYVAPDFSTKEKAQALAGWNRVHKKKGPPTMAVMMPMGSSAGARMLRDTKSQTTRKAA